jgi:hypothetical protein
MSNKRAADLKKNDLDQRNVRPDYSINLKA